MPRTALVVLLVAFAGSPRAADDLPPRALARLGDHAFHHGPGIAAVAVSPDGAVLASAAEYPESFGPVGPAERSAYERTVVLWDAATGRRLREIGGGLVRHLAFSPDGKKLAAGCVGFRVYDVATGRQIGPTVERADALSHLAFSADGERLLAAEHHGPVTAWDVATGKELRHWVAPATGTGWVPRDHRVIAGIPSPDGRFVAWKLWRLPDYGRLPPGIISPPAVQTPTTLVVVDAATEKPAYWKDFPDGSLNAFTFTPDGRRFLAGALNVTVWETATGAAVASVDAAGTARLAPSPDGRQVAVVEGNSRVRLWDLASGEVVHELCPGLVYLGMSPTFSADGKTLVLATDTTLRLFDPATGRERTPPGHRSDVAVRFSADGKTLFTTCAEARRSWNLSARPAPAVVTHRPRQSWEGICGEQALAHSADGRSFLATRPGRWEVAVLHETATGRPRCELEGGITPGDSGAFTADGTGVLTWGSVGLVRVHDARTGKKTSEFRRAREIGPPVVSPDSGFVAWSDRAQDVHLHDGRTGALVRVLRSTRPLPGGEARDGQIAFSAEAEYLAVAGYPEDAYTRRSATKWDALPVRIFHVPTGREVSRFFAAPAAEVETDEIYFSGRIACSAFSPDGRLFAVATGRSGMIRLVEVATGRVRAELTGHRHGVRGLAFSPDGRALASGGDDNVAFLWDVAGARTGTPADPTDAALAGWWADLAKEDYGAAAALAGLVRSPGRSVPYLAERLRPVEALTPARLTRLLADLDADDFDAREAASRDLERLGEQGEADLRRALDGPLPPEVRRRVEAFLDRAASGPLPETLRALRTVEALEHSGTPEAVRHLEALAKGAPEARTTQAAKAALTRARAARPAPGLATPP